MTLSPPAVLLGVQEPRLLSRPDWVSTSGVEAIDLAESAGVFLDPWQKLGVEVALSEAEGGNWAAFETALLVARQNGKGEVILVLCLAGLFLLGEVYILHSAHEFKTAKEAYLRIRAVIEGAPHLSRLVRQFRQSNEDTSIELTSGARLRFMARSTSSGRGFSAQRLIVDEAQILSSAAMGALMPTLAAQPNPQVNYFGTVPRPEDNSEHFTSVRDRGRAGDDPFLAWAEWNIGEHCDDLDDREMWAAGNPTLGRRISEQALARMRASLSEENFAREIGSLWTESAGRSVIDMEAWAALAGAEDARPTPVAFGLAASPDRKWSTIAMAGVRSDGSRHVEVVQTGRGTDWVVARVAALVADWQPVGVAVSPDDPIASLIPDLEKHERNKLVKVSNREMAQGCGMVVDGVTDGSLHHSGQQLLTIAVGAARKKRTGETWVWAPPAGGDTDVSPLKAVTAALFTLAKQPVPKAARTYTF